MGGLWGLNDHFEDYGSEQHYMAIMAVITAAEANQSFSRLLREVAGGACFTVLSRGRAVATISSPDPDLGAYGAARASLLQRLMMQEPRLIDQPLGGPDVGTHVRIS
jgi:antitoxin (DNA-binding transcriptional repressor) of toxin-antitoxin stability system